MANSRAVFIILVTTLWFTFANGIDFSYRSDEETRAPTIKPRTKPPPTTGSGSDEDSDDEDSDDGEDFDMMAYSASADAVASEAEYSASASAASASSDSSDATTTFSKHGMTVSTYRNWVGPQAYNRDYSCWREAHIMDVCPTNYDRHERTGTCWTECPMDFPLECGMECLHQNDDCAMAIFTKTGVVASLPLKLATKGLFGAFEAFSHGFKSSVYCAMGVLTVTRGFVRLIRYIKINDPQTSEDKLLAILFRTNNFIIDLPVAILSCMGKKPGDEIFLANKVLATAQFMLYEILHNQDTLLTSWGRFKAFLIGANFTAAANSITDGEIGSLEDAMKANTTCAENLKDLVSRTWSTVLGYKKENPQMSANDIRLKIQDTPLMTSDIATVTNNCMPQLIGESDERTAYKTRGTIRKTMATVVNQLISRGKSNNGSHAALKYTAYKVIDRGLTLMTITGKDFTGFASVTAEYLQTICGPTQFMGEIDDGVHPDTLGLTLKQKAFNGSSLSWEREGDGKVILKFTSVDTKNVTVNIKSAGDKIDEVDVAAGKTVTWISNVTFLGGRTLYLDRWRPGLLGLPGTGGGSLLLWVPKAADGGHLNLTVRLNVS